MNKQTVLVTFGLLAMVTMAFSSEKFSKTIQRPLEEGSNGIEWNPTPLLKQEGSGIGTGTGTGIIQCYQCSPPCSWSSCCPDYRPQCCWVDGWGCACCPES